jgi:hypothetical protein
MAVFPESARRKPQFGYNVSPAENVKRTSPEAGNSYMRDSWGTQRFVATMEFLVQEADAQVLMAFYDANRLLGFTMFDFNKTSVTAQNIGTGNGAITAFTVPGKEIESYSVYKDGVLQGSGYTVSSGTGSLGEDQIVFSVAPANGVVVTITTVLRKRYTVEFAESPSVAVVGYKKTHISFKVQQKFPLS